ncbi:MAG: DegT/DnrJ/EryC1/StrS family aminotransferase [Lachnospiraceae bacterium]|jgi:dTDP-4-amino-4,6-dideoxygalactose transaminase|nr:DegT/DnrJ/EryC1/StrS family aminotransferase [Lachnospiraceae bacterium]
MKEDGANLDKRILVTRSSMPELDEYMEEIKEMWDTHWLTNMGVKHKQLEKDLADYLGIGQENIALFVNGHLALECIIEALGLGREKNANGEYKVEVITTPFTFASTTHAIVRKGLKPVFCDINPVDFTIDSTKLERLITDRTCAIIPVHVYGNLCNVDEIKKISDKYGLKVIYDAAHAFAVEKEGVSSASFGDAAMYSFHATKVFNTIEGGAVCFKDPMLKSLLNQWKNFGIMGAESVEFIGGNAKMNEFAAAMGICNLRHLDDEIGKRRRIDQRYREWLGNINGVRLNVIPDGVKSNYAYFPIVVDETVVGCLRDEIFDALADNGISARKYFYPLTNTYQCYEEIFDATDTPIALTISQRVLTLPMYADLSLEDVDFICNIVKNCISN